MTKVILSAAIAVGLLGASAVPMQAAVRVHRHHKTAKRVGIGAAGGAAVGAVAGGPVGAAVGAAAGAGAGKAYDVHKKHHGQ